MDESRNVIAQHPRRQRDLRQQIHLSNKTRDEFYTVNTINLGQSFTSKLYSIVFNTSFG